VYKVARHACSRVQWRQLVTCSLRHCQSVAWSPYSLKRGTKAIVATKCLHKTRSMAVCLQSSLIARSTMRKCLCDAAPALTALHTVQHKLSTGKGSSDKRKSTGVSLINFWWHMTLHAPMHMQALPAYYTICSVWLCKVCDCGMHIRTYMH
jgi:hypothetical protein